MNTDKLIEIEERRQNLHNEAVKVIEDFVAESEEAEIKVDPIFWGGLETDPLTIEYITATQVLIYHNGKQINRVQWRLLTLDKLLEIGLKINKS